MTIIFVLRLNLGDTLVILHFIITFSGLCPDWDSWDQDKPVNNAREAMQQADDWLGIPQVCIHLVGCSLQYSVHLSGLAHWISL